MNKEITDDLFEFWSFIGKKTNRLIEHSNCKSVSTPNADWLNRVFDLSVNNNAFSNIHDLSKKEEIPDIITIPETENQNISTNEELLFSQRNMALDLVKIRNKWKNDENIKQVKTDEDAEKFANTASEAFGYLVDSETISLIYNETSKIRMFNYMKKDKSLGCGIIFLDSNSNAGFHMIGTIPEARGKGIGTLITQRLISEAIKSSCKNCVLHASEMGESLYKKLGFNSFGVIETYRIQ